MAAAPDVYSKILSDIIREQEIVVGSLAWEIAAKVPNLEIVDKPTYQVSMKGEPQGIINDIVLRFQKVFGTLAIDVSKRAVGHILADMPIEDIPVTLR